MKVLLVEDNKRVATALRESLRGSYTVDIEHSGKAALENDTLDCYDVILLDLGLPDMHGGDVCQQMRQQKVVAPIIVITGDARVASKVSALDYGADDYLTKPFSRDELKARIRAVLRRASNGTALLNLRFADIEIDPVARRVVRGGKEITLRRKEFDLLEYMVRNPNRTLSRTAILDHVWGNNHGLWNNSVDVHVKYLRDKIDRPFGSHFIKTIHGVGYRLGAETTVDSNVVEHSLR